MAADESMASDTADRAAGRASRQHVLCRLGSGDDSRAGTSRRLAWKTLDKVNATELKPGDRVLLKADPGGPDNLAREAPGQKACRWRSTGTPMGHFPASTRPGCSRMPYGSTTCNLSKCATSKSPILAIGQRIAAVFTSFWTTSALARHIVIAGLYVHDVNGSNGNGDNAKDNGGIIFRTNGDKKPSRFDGLIIEGNIVWKVDRSGIAAQSYHWSRAHGSPAPTS